MWRILHPSVVCFCKCFYNWTVLIRSFLFASTLYIVVSVDLTPCLTKNSLALSETSSPKSAITCPTHPYLQNISSKRNWHTTKHVFLRIAQPSTWFHRSSRASTKYFIHHSKKEYSTDLKKVMGRGFSTIVWSSLYGSQGVPWSHHRLDRKNVALHLDGREWHSITL